MLRSIEVPGAWYPSPAALTVPVNVPPVFGIAATALSYADFTAEEEAAVVVLELETLEETVGIDGLFVRLL